MSNTPNEHNKSSKKSPQRESAATKTFQLPKFPADLLGRVNATVEYLEMDRTKFMVEILEEVMEDLDVQRLRKELQEKWSKRQANRQSRKAARTA